MEIKHNIDGDLDTFLGERKYLPWSTSRVDTAGCMKKFFNVYLTGTKESSLSLTLGSLSHEVIASLLKDGSPTIDKAKEFMTQALPLYRNEFTDFAADQLYSFLPYMVDFTERCMNFGAKNNIKWRIERQYGLKENMTRAHYKPMSTGETFIRGIVDLWGYDAKSKTLYVIDHKTNKAALSQKAVAEHHQLLFYVAMLTLYFKLDWNTCYIALNFIRKEKIVWAKVTKATVREFMHEFIHYLYHLEEKICVCDIERVWPEEPSFTCSWCAFKDKCPGVEHEV